MFIFSDVCELGITHNSNNNNNNTVLLIVLGCSVVIHNFLVYHYVAYSSKLFLCSPLHTQLMIQK
jgi:hypothetical protein